MIKTAHKEIKQGELALYVLPVEAPMSDAIKLLNEQGPDTKFVVVTSAHGKLRGTITDGDIRRGILNGFGLEDPLVRIMFPKPLSCKFDDPAELIQQMMFQVGSINPFLPLTDADNFLVSILIGVRNANVPMTALIMAGGFGKRLGEKTRSKPKPLIEVSGKPLLEHVLLNLEQSAVDKVYVSTHFLSDQIRSYIKATGREGYVTILDEKTPLGTAGSIGLLPRDMSGRLIVTNSDVLTDLDYRSFGEFGSNSDRDVSLAIVEHKVYIPFGVVSQSPDGRYVSVVEKPVITNNILAGIYCFPTEVIKLLKVDEKLDMPDFLTRVVENKFQINLFPLHEYWTDVGTPEDLSKAISRTQSKS